jgi:hypothetical protein
MRNKSEARNPKGAEILDFGFRICFGFRYSDFEFALLVIRRITANARLSEPKRSTTACVPANSVRSGSRPSSAMISISGSRACRVSSSRSSAMRRRGRISRRRKRLARNCWRRDSSLEDVERPDAGRQRFRLQVRLEVGA